MAKNTSIVLSDQLSEFIEGEIATGRFSSASEVVRAGLRLLEEEALKLEALRNALIEGEKSGPARPFDFDKFLATRRRSA